MTMPDAARQAAAARMAQQAEELEREEQGIGSASPSGANTPHTSEDRDLNIGEHASTLDQILDDPDFGRLPETVWHWKRRGIDIPIRALDPKIHDILNKKHTIKKTNPRTGVVVQEFDANKYNLDVISFCMMEPDINDASVRNRIASKAKKPNFNSIKDILDILFLPGEQQSLFGACAQLSGWTEVDEAVVQEVKD